MDEALERPHFDGAAEVWAASRKPYAKPDCDAHSGDADRGPEPPFLVERLGLLHT